MPPNPATIWAMTVVDALAGAGMRAVCLAPGSRSTALALAFAAHKDMTIYRHLDERSAAFFALGMALATDRPVALLCTSGTAGANFYPAVIEARMSQVPLLVITADRPDELRHSGANQTIDQVGLYGQQVLWQVDLPMPQPDAPAVALRHLRTTVVRAVAKADGLVKGPVHLNVPFRKPFEPAGGEQPYSAPDTQITRGRLLATAEQVASVAALIAENPRGLIVCGPRCPEGAFAAAVAELASKAGYPLLADPLSGLRYGPWTANRPVIGGYENYLSGGRDPVGQSPQLILRFGALPTGKWVSAYLARQAEAQHIHVRANGVWADDQHLTGRFLQVDAHDFCRRLSRVVATRADRSWVATVLAQEQNLRRRLPALLADVEFDGAAVADVVAGLPAEAHLFVGNSLPIRHVDQFSMPRRERLHVYANRGASGIDGNISTGLGIAAAHNRPVVMLLGDITFYHDMNGLLAVRNLGLTPIIVLLNNDGGGIFQRLPIAAHDPPFTDLFRTPHGLDFAPAAAMYGLDYTLVADRPGLRAALADALQNPRPIIIEYRSDSAVDEAVRQQITFNR
jgi:2-succinyl-5-enolpyruvyl-6-hydroxy-3-cyclohexene-1-carboxylate synthase